MPRLAAPVLLLLLAVGVNAAPVPKGIKKSTNPDGTWKLVEFWTNGQKGSAAGMTPVWVLEGEVFYVGPKQDSNYWQLTIPDSSKPHLRKFAHGKQATSYYPAAVEVDGDTLKFCYAGSEKAEVTEAKPTAAVYYYVFTRVTGDAAPTPDDPAPPVDDLPLKKFK